MNTNEISKNWIFNQNLLKCGINEEIPRVCDGQKSPKKNINELKRKEKKELKTKENRDKMKILYIFLCNKYSD